MSGTINLKKIITNPNIIAVALGLVVFCLPFKLPEIIAEPASMIGDINTTMAMLLLGILFARFEFDKTYLKRIIKFTLLRLVVASIINLGIIFIASKIFANVEDIKIVSNNLKKRILIIADKMMLFVIYICSMCPSATSVPSLACVFDEDKSYASLVVSITSLFCIVTIPSFVALAEYLLNL